MGSGVGRVSTACSSAHWEDSPSPVSSRPCTTKHMVLTRLGTSPGAFTLLSIGCKDPFPWWLCSRDGEELSVLKRWVPGESRVTFHVIAAFSICLGLAAKVPSPPDHPHDLEGLTTPGL